MHMKKRLFLKAILNGKELHDALFAYVLEKYKDKKHLKEAIEAGTMEFLTYSEMPLAEDARTGKMFVKSLVIEVRARDDEVKDNKESNDGGLRQS